MYKYIKQRTTFIVFLIYAIYFTSTLYSALNKNIEIVYAVILTIPLYYLSIHKLTTEYNKNKRITLVTILKSSLFIILPFKFMQHVNFLESNKTLLYVSNIDVNLSNSLHTIFIVIVAFISLEIGNLIARFRKQKKSKPTKIQFNKKNIFLFFLIITTLANLYLSQSGISGYDVEIKYTYGYYSFVRTFSNLINPVVLMLASFYALNNNYGVFGKTLYYILLTTQVSLGLLSGMKETALIPIVIYAIFFLDAGKKINTVYIVSIVTFIVLLYPINNNYRNFINSGYYKKTNPSQVYLLAINDLFQSSEFSEIFDKGFKQYSNRSDIYSYLDHSIQNESNWVYYKNMTRYLTAPFYPIIPRFLWKNKPRADAGGEYYKLINYNTNSAVSVSCIGWAYLEGGTLPVMIIFIFIGFWLRKLNSFDTLKNKVIWATVFLIVIKPEWDPFSMIVGFIQSLILINIIFWLFKLEKKHIV